MPAARFNIFSWLSLRDERTQLETIWREQPSLHSDFALYRQRADSAEVLWSQGSQADALWLAQEAYRSLSSAQSLYQASFPSRTLPQKLQSSQAEIERRLEAGLPALDAQITEDHETLFEDVRAYTTKVAKHLRWSTRNLSEFRSVVRARYWTLGLVGLAVVGCLAFFMRPKPPVSATASSFLVDGGGTAYYPDRAMDGVASTEWLPSDGEPANWSVRFRNPKAVQTVTILNGNNAPAFDRGISHFKVILLRDGRKLEEKSGHLESSHAPSPTPVRFSRSFQADEIRIEVLSHHGLSAALAEVKWD